MSWLSLGRLAELSWGLEVFVVVTATLIVRACADNSPLDDNNYPLSFLNVGSGEEVTIKELAELIAHELDFTGSIVWDESKPNGNPRKLLDIEKIKSIGWRPTISLKEGIKKTLVNYKEDLRNKILRI